MSDIDFTDENDDYQPEPDTQGRNPLRQRMKQLEAENAEMRKHAAEAAELRRKMAFLEAGIDMSAPAAKYFVKGYDGELTAEAIRQAAVEAQLISPDNPVSADETEAWNRTTRVAAGSGTAQPPVDWATRLSQASSEAELMAILAEAQASQ